MTLYQNTDLTLPSLNINLDLPFCPEINSLKHANELKFKNKDSLKILYLNARSIKNKVEDLNNILKEIKSLIHVVAISESWLSAYEVSLLNVTDYYYFV